jgi:imidazoleglycerol-phosphate dehydratase
MITITRKTNETDINVALEVYGSGKCQIATGVPFLDHMLEQLARHGLMDITITCDGDTHIDDHHSTEDVGIALGQAFCQAMGDKKGLTRFGSFYAPLDEALSRVVVDLSGRPSLHMGVNWTSGNIGKFDTQLVGEFFQGFVNNALITLHVDTLKGINTHHQVESVFKAFARALRIALTIDEKQQDNIPSSKGVL